MTDTNFDFDKYRKLLEHMGKAAGYQTLGDLSEKACGTRTLLYATTNSNRRTTMPRLETMHSVAQTLGCKPSDILRALGY